MNYIDLRSDTVTWPTPAMREAMAAAPVGDDVYGDDPTMNELEARAAARVRKEAALFVPSGTFGNQLALFTWCPRGTEVILGEQCHIVQHEAGAASVIAGVQIRPLDAPDGVLEPEAVRARIREEDIHYPATSLVCMENAHSSGRVVSLAAMDAVREVASSRSLPVHLDGARLFNAATTLGVEASAIAARADSVMFCLSKGLCAPVGSILAGPRSFIDAARKKRKIMGGGMRQAGVLAAAGLIALDEMTLRLGQDHENARRLARLLAAVPGVVVDESSVEINMVFFKVKVEGKAAAFDDALVAAMRERGVLISAASGGEYRFVTHYWVDHDRVEKAAAAFAESCEEASARAR
jgi:threonine aldolase